MCRGGGGGGGCERASERASKWATGCGGRGGRGVAVGRAAALLVVCWWLLEAGSGTPRRVRHGGFIGQGSGRVWTLGRHMRSARPPSANNACVVASPQRPYTSLGEWTLSQDRARTLSRAGLKSCSDVDRHLVGSFPCSPSQRRAMGVSLSLSFLLLSPRPQYWTNKPRSYCLRTHPPCSGAQNTSHLSQWAITHHRRYSITNKQ